MRHDELKNQRGRGGFTTHDLKRCQLLANTVALVYNWWSPFVRPATVQCGTARDEAVAAWAGSWDAVRVSQVIRPPMAKSDCDSRLLIGIIGWATEAEAPRRAKRGWQ